MIIKTSNDWFWALDQMKEGKHVRRQAWQNKYYKLAHIIYYRAYNGQTGKTMEPLLTYSDYKATDWCLAELSRYQNGDIAIVSGMSPAIINNDKLIFANEYNNLVVLDSAGSFILDTFHTLATNRFCKNNSEPITYHGTRIYEKELTEYDFIIYGVEQDSVNVTDAIGNSYKINIVDLLQNFYVWQK